MADTPAEAYESFMPDGQKVKDLERARLKVPNSAIRSECPTIAQRLIHVRTESSHFLGIQFEPSG